MIEIESPLVSIIIPVYNTEKYLNRCIKSISNQTYKNLEIILVDDGSEDKSLEICLKLAQNDKRITVITKKNEGQAVARNIALDKCSGDFIGFVDSDDYIGMDMIESLIHYLMMYEADVSICGFYTDYVVMKKKHCVFPNIKVFNNHDLMEAYINTPNINSVLWNKIYKKKLWENVRFPTMRSKEDMFIMHEILGKADKAVHIGEAKYIQFVRPGSTEQSSFSLADLNLISSVKSQQEYILANYPDLKDDVILKLIKAYITIMKKIHSSFSYFHFTELYNEMYRQLLYEKHVINLDLYKNDSEYIKTKKIIKYRFFYIVIKGIYSGFKAKIITTLIIIFTMLRCNLFKKNFDA